MSSDYYGSVAGEIADRGAAGRPDAMDLWEQAGGPPLLC